LAYIQKAIESSLQLYVNKHEKKTEDTEYFTQFFIFLQEYNVFIKNKYQITIIFFDS